MSKLFADSNRASLREIIEDNQNWGVTPVAGRTRARRFTSSSVSVNKETTTSQEIRDDRMVSSVIETAAGSGGDINWEFAAGTIDNDLQRALMGTWTRPMDFDVFRGQIVSIVANNQIKIAGRDLTGYYLAGRRIRTNGFLTPANNDYLQISAVAFAAGATTITVTATTLVAEAGNAFTSVADANDVIVLKNNTIRCGTAGARTFDSNGGNVFAAAVAAKQLVAGQRIFVEGIGYETGTLTLAAVVDGDVVTISDGVAAYTFEAQADAAVVDADDVTFAVGVDDTATAANLVAAINARRIAGDLAVSASSAAGVVTLVNLNKDGGSISNAAATITVVDFAGGDADAGGFYTVVTATDDVITVDRDVPTIAAGKLITIKGSMLKNPGKSADIIPQSASLETGFQDVSQFFLSNGMRTGGLSLEVSSGAVVKGTTKIMGKETKRAVVAKLEDAAYTVLDAAATEVVSATANVGQLLIDGVAAATAIQSIKLDIDGSLREQRAVGSKFAQGIAAGRLNITGTVTAYFADGAMYDRFINHDTASIAFPIIDQDKNTYFWTVPAFKVSSDPIAPGGIDQDVMDTMEITAFRDAATQCMIQIDRFSSTTPVTAL